jgi:hypothetical protein
MPEIPPLARQHAEELSRSLGCALTAERAADRIFLVFHKVSLPPGAYNQDRSDVLVITDVQYPMSAMDMFWMEPAMALRSGQIPSHASTLESYLGRQWRRWSWHRQVPWVPGADDLFTHWAIIEACWNKEAKRE